VYEVFDRQCDIALGSLEKLYERIGNRISVILVSAADFGMQHGLLVSPKPTANCSSPSTFASTTGFTKTPNGKPSSTPAVRSSQLLMTLSMPVSTSSTRCNAPPR
jgi:hypothetical protein